MDLATAVRLRQAGASWEKIAVTLSDAPGAEPVDRRTVQARVLAADPKLVIVRARSLPGM
jgi:hypothetical protein